MPASHPPVRAHPGKPFRTILDAAKDDQALTIRCNMCGRRIHYLASDLIQVIDPNWPLHIPPFDCRRCGKEYVDIKAWSVQAEHLGKIPIRRPYKQVTKWKVEMLGDVKE